MKTDKATWIWYPGDFEIWLGNRFNNRRTERGAMFPPFWKQDSHWVTVEFSKAIELQRTERVTIYTEGDFNLKIDGILQFGMPETFLVPRGRHEINIKVHNPATPPALFLEGETLKSDGSWLATYEDKIWIDEHGVAHGSGQYVAAGQWNFDDPEQGPSTFALPRRNVSPTVGLEELEGRGILADFGKETMGYLVLRDIQGEGLLNIYYGESREEALDKAYCETLDQIEVVTDGFIDDSTNHFTDRTPDYTLRQSKAFRYVYLEGSGSVRIGGVEMDEEYAPQDPEHSGSFRCNDDEVNRIWDISSYTMDLTTREFFVDGIKRDRWVWSGDAIQSYLMNYYLRFDTECVKRTIRQLRGKDPVTAHVNTIMDYTFYWFKSIHDCYLYTGELEFVRELYPKMRTLMAYCLSRTDKDGMAEAQSDDWVFIDWVDFPMHKRGKVCFEQILFCKALETMSVCATLLRDHPLQDPPQGSITTEEYAADARRYGHLHEDLLEKTRLTFWDEEHGAFIHAIEDGKPNPMITKFPNMFALLYGYAPAEMRDAILRNVLLNPEVEAITTPYMRFYELEALCQTGQQCTVLQEMKTYWGGMVREGATTFWEKYIPTESGTQHLAMYGRRYGKSLCHAWGASPLYLLGRYYLGVRPTKAGYEEYEVSPCLGGLEWIEGDVPTPFGKIHVRAEKGSITVRSDGGKGTLVIGDRRIDIPAGETVGARWEMD